MRLGKFGWTCMAIIVILPSISAVAEAKKKKHKKNHDIDYVGNYYNSYGKRESFESFESRESNESRKSFDSKNSIAATSNLTEVRINSRYRNLTKHYTAMTVNFNPSFRVPNCVSYVLTNTMVTLTDGPGAEHRRNYKFYSDPSVTGCPEWYDYKQSGYDRGHMAPANDMRWSRQSMQDCFLMTNICPQDHDLNGGSWNRLELKIHDWAKRYGKIVVATGPIFNGSSHRIGQNNDIVVPSGFYKVVLDPSRNRAIGFVYDNHEGGGGVKRHACTVDEVERITGHDFFAALPDNVERLVESSCNYDQWN